MKKFLATLGILGVSLLPLACSNSPDDDVYRPAAFGENGQCYYVQDKSEADAMIADGSCDRSWAATPMPAYWLFMYAPFYHSPAYYDQYVPSHRRNTFISRTNAWEKNPTNIKQIDAAKSRATWKNSEGKTVAGTRINYTKAGFGSGNVRSGGFSSGARCMIKAELSVLGPPTKPPSPSPKPPSNSPTKSPSPNSPSKSPSVPGGKPGTAKPSVC